MSLCNSILQCFVCMASRSVPAAALLLRPCIRGCFCKPVTLSVIAAFLLHGYVQAAVLSASPAGVLAAIMLFSVLTPAVCVHSPYPHPPSLHIAMHSLYLLAGNRGMTYTVLEKRLYTPWTKTTNCNVLFSELLEILKDLLKEASRRQVNRK